MKRKYFISNFSWFYERKTWEVWFSNDDKNEEIEEFLEWERTANQQEHNIFQEFGLKDLVWKRSAVIRYDLKDLSPETFNKIEVGDYVAFIHPPFREERKGFFEISWIGVIRQVSKESMLVMIDEYHTYPCTKGIHDFNVNPDTVTMLEITNEKHIEFIFEFTIHREYIWRRYNAG